MKQRASAMTFPQNMPRNRIISERLRKVRPSRRRPAPRAESNAMVDVLSRMMMSSDVTMVTPDTSSIIIRMTAMFTLSRDSQENICG